MLLKKFFIDVCLCVVIAELWLLLGLSFVVVVVFVVCSVFDAVELVLPAHFLIGLMFVLSLGKNPAAEWVLGGL